MKYSTDIENYIDIIREYARMSHYVLEIGPAKGDGSTQAILEGLEQNRVRDKLFVSVDIRDYMEIKPQVDYWYLILGDSRDYKTADRVLKNFPTRKPDLIFIDTDHTYEQMQRELEVWWGISKDTTKWLFHDTYMMGEYNHMTDAIKEFADKHNLVYKDLSIEAHGLALMYAD